MMLYHSKKPTVHYLFPKDYHFPPGDFELFSTKSKKILVDKNAILDYKIGNAEAMKLLTAELNTQVGDLMKGIQKVASKISAKEDPTQKEKESPSEEKKDASIAGKIAGGLEFFTLSTKVMTVFWKIAKTDDEQELALLKTEMHSLKKQFQEKGYSPKEDFEEVPFKLKEKYQKNGDLEGFRNAAKEFENLLKGTRKGTKQD
ncbi:MAG: hypothetical protein R2793_06895 [Flavobacteriaceae bacterium]